MSLDNVPDNVPRLTSPCHYSFKMPTTGEPLTYIGIEAAPDSSDWYRFTYLDGVTLNSIEVDKDLNIRWENGVLTMEPYSKIEFLIPEIRLSLALHVNSPEDFFKGNATVHVSEAQELGLINTQNYKLLQGMLGDRLLGAINLKITRSTVRIETVDSCVVNEGEIPTF